MDSRMYNGHQLISWSMENINPADYCMALNGSASTKFLED